jgi:hypothetical protein
VRLPFRSSKPMLERILRSAAAAVGKARLAISQRMLHPHPAPHHGRKLVMRGKRRP